MRGARRPATRANRIESRASIQYRDDASGNSPRAASVASLGGVLKLLNVLTVRWAGGLGAGGRPGGACGGGGSLRLSNRPAPAAAAL